MPRSASAPPRDVHADCLKAAAILGVVCIHAGVPFNDVFRFGAPAFIGLWAFYAEKALMRRAPEAHFRYLAKRWIELFIPYLAWTLVYIGIFHAHKWSVAPMRTVIGGWFGGFGWAGQYYFVVLLQLIALLPWLRRLVTARSVMPLIMAGCLFNWIAGYWLFQFKAFMVVGDRVFIYWTPYVFMGIALARGYFAGRPRHLLLLAALLLLGAPFDAQFAVETPYFPVTVTLASLLLLVAAVVGDRTAKAAAGRIDTHWTAALVGVVARNTFAIFVSNVLMIELMRRAKWTEFLQQNAGAPGFAIVVICAIAGAVSLGWLLKALRLGVLVGKA